jgi:hypothetical protein
MAISKTLAQKRPLKGRFQGKRVSCRAIPAYAINWQRSQAGTHRITAPATDNLGASSAVPNPIINPPSLSQGAGLYFVVPDHSGTPFRRLIPVNWSRVDSALYHMGIGRSGFMLHPVSVSQGCITVSCGSLAGMAQHNNIANLLRAENGDNIVCVSR